MQDIPVLIIVFNRAWNAVKVAESLQKIRPKQLFLAADGPRPERPGEEKLCNEAREAVLNAVTWECDVKVRFQEKNLGCGKHMTAAIDWFFENVESGMILEDDCVPSEDFFHFTGELLERYRNCHKVLMLSGTALVTSPVPSGNAYEFLSFPCCWGWATWRRAWQLMSYDMPDFPAYRRSGAIGELFPARRHQKRLLELFEKVYTHAPGFDTWDFQWLYACVKNKGLCILPAKNLVTNVGCSKVSRSSVLPKKDAIPVPSPSRTGISPSPAGRSFQIRTSCRPAISGAILQMADTVPAISSSPDILLPERRL